MGMTGIQENALGDDEQGIDQQENPEAILQAIRDVIKKITKLESEGLTLETHEDIAEIVDRVRDLIEAGLFYQSHDTIHFLNRMLKETGERKYRKKETKHQEPVLPQE